MHALARLASPLVSLTLAAGCATPLPPPPGFETGVAQPALRSGDTWTFQVRDGYNGSVLRRFTERALEAGATGVTMDVIGGPQPLTARLTGSLNPVESFRVRSGLLLNYAPEYPALKFPLAPGTRWRERYEIDDPLSGTRISALVIASVQGWDRVRVPAGEFDALRISRQTYLEDEEFWRWGTRGTETDWYAPAARRVVRHEESSEFTEKSGRWPNNIRRNDWSVVELIGYRLAGE